MDIVIKNQIRRLRFDNGEMTQRELARKSGCTRQTIHAIEAAKYGPSERNTLAIRGEMTMTSSRRTEDRIRRHPLLAFLTIAFGISWLLARIYYKAHDALGITSPQALLDDVEAGGRRWVLYLLISSCYMAGPAAAALVVMGVQGSREGLKTLTRRILRWRVPWYWYLVALALPVALTVMWTVGVPYLLGIPYSAGLATSRLWIPVALLPLMVVGCLGEEVGWRGCALPQLQERFNPMAASVILGVIHWAWHLPLWIASSALPYHLIRIVLLTFMFTWIYNNTQSVLLTTLFHSSYAWVSIVYRSHWGTGFQSMLAHLAVSLLIVAVLVVSDPRFRQSSGTELQDRGEGSRHSGSSPGQVP